MLLHHHRQALWVAAILTLALTPQFTAASAADQTFLGVWSTSHSTSTVADESLVPGSSFIISINATDLPPVINATEGGINGFDITVHYDPAILNATDADIKSPLCPAAEGCLFDRSGAFSLTRKLNSTEGTVRIAAVIFQTTVGGSGTLFRIKFETVGVSFASIDIREDVSLLTGPTRRQIVIIPYQALDGSFKNAGGNIPPVALFTATPTSPSVSQQVSFDASQSYDPDGTITGYYWNLGDGATATGGHTIHGFPASGNYTVTLTVTDNQGAIGLQTRKVSISPPGNTDGSNTGQNPASHLPTPAQTIAIAATALVSLLAILVYTRRRKRP